MFSTFHIIYRDGLFKIVEKFLHENDLQILSSRDQP